MIFWIIIGVAFYNLANNYGKNKWMYLGIGIGLTLLTQLLVGFFWGVVRGLTHGEESTMDNLAVNLVALLISGIITYIVYRQLKAKAEREYQEREDVIHNFGVDIAPEPVEKNETE